MPLTELNRKFFKAHLLMGIGAFLGVIVASLNSFSYPLLYGFLSGLLLSVHTYRQCLIVLIEEYKRLRNKHNTEYEDIS